MLESKLGGARLPYDEGPEKFKPALALIHSLRKKFLCVNRFRRDREFHYDSLDETAVILDIGALRAAVPELVKQADEYGVCSFDMEGPTTRMPDVLLVQFLGGPSTIIHTWKIMQRSNKSAVSEALTDLFRVLFSSDTIVLGSNIARDMPQIEKWFDLPLDLPLEWQNVFPLVTFFRVALASEVYHPQIVEFLRGKNEGGQGVTKYGLGWVGLAENRFNHKVFSHAKFRKFGTEAQWCDFDPDRKASTKIWMYEWDRDLTKKQMLYCHLDLVTPLRMVTSLMAYLLIYDLEGFQDGLTLREMLWQFLGSVYKGLVVPAVDQTVLECGDDGDRQSDRCILTSPNSSIIPDTTLNNADKSNPTTTMFSHRKRTRSEAGEESEDEPALRLPVAQPPGVPYQKRLRRQQRLPRQPEVVDLEMSPAVPRAASPELAADTLAAPRTSAAEPRARTLSLPAAADAAGPCSLTLPSATASAAGPCAPTLPSATSSQVAAADTSKSQSEGAAVLFESAVLRDRDLQDAHHERTAYQILPHPQDLANPQVPLYLRYVDPDFVFKPKNFSRECQRSKRKASLSAKTERLQGCNHRRSRTVLSRTRCHHCGTVHANRPEACAVARYHKVMSLHLEHYVTLTFFPCLHCDSTGHATPMCPILHSWCRVCEQRGHKAFPHPNKSETKLFTAKFGAFSCYGVRTKKAQGFNHHRWGHVPADHHCGSSGTSLSESETEQ